MVPPPHRSPTLLAVLSLAGCAGAASSVGGRGEPTLTESAAGAGGAIGDGLEGGWSIEHSDLVNGARFIHPVNTDKDGAIVASRLVSALAGPATSDARAAALNPTRMSDAAYVDEVAAFIVHDLYGELAQAGERPLLGTDTLVLTSVHRFGLYAAEALHARVLPLQFISFADSWDQVVEASSRATVIVGQDYEYDGLWLWNKLAAGEPGTEAAALPSAYLEALAEASEVLIVQPDDSWALCTASYCSDVVSHTYDGAETPIYLHSSLTQSGAVNAGTALYAEAVAAGLVSTASPAGVANLKQWEWGVPDSAVTNIQTAWAALGKPPENLKVIRGGVVDMFGWSPRLWMAYLARNGLSPRGFHFSSYWVANTQLERYGAILPFPSYAYWQEAWHPLDDNAREILAEVCGGETCPASVAAMSRAFVNEIGGATDSDGVRAVMEDFALTASVGAWYGFGINAEGAADWTGWSGESVPSAWELAATEVQDPERSPYLERDWTPLTVDELCGLDLFACE